MVNHEFTSWLISWSLLENHKFYLVVVRSSPFFLLKIQSKTQKLDHTHLHCWYISALLDTLYVQLEIHNHLKPGHLHILHGYHCFQLESKF